jgi:hypothetical protein
MAMATTITGISITIIGLTIGIGITKIASHPQPAAPHPADAPSSEDGGATIRRTEVAAFDSDKYVACMAGEGEAPQPS